MGADATSEPAKQDAEQVLGDSTPTSPSEPAKPTPLVTFIVKRWRRLQRWVLWIFPNWDAVNRADLVYEQAHDVEENEETRVPPELELRVPMVWGCELYGPAEIDGLYKGLEKLEWGVVGRLGDQDGIAKWIRESRAYGQQDAWLNGGRIVAPNERGKYLATYNFASLPEGVSYLDVQVF